MSVVYNTVARRLQPQVVPGDNFRESPAIAANQVARLTLSLQSLNLRFLSIVASLNVRSSNFDSSSFDSLSRSLRDRPPIELAAIASCPIALFDLDFGSVDRWNRLLAVECAQDTACTDGSDSRLAAFVQSIGFFAWHASQADRTFVSFALGLHRSTVRLLSSVSIMQALVAAGSMCNSLTPRWIGNRCFWPDLLRFAAAEMQLPFQASKLQACQLAAGTRVIDPCDDRSGVRHSSRI